MTATFVSLLSAVFLLTQAAKHSQEHSLLQPYCSSGDIYLSTPVASGSPFDPLYRAIWNDPDFIDGPGGDKYAVPAIILFSILTFFAFSCWIFMISVTCCNKVCFCTGRMPSKSKFSICERVMESFFICCVIACSCSAFVYSLYTKEEGDASICRLYNLEDMWLNGNEEFIGFNQINDILVNASNDISYLQDYYYDEQVPTSARNLNSTVNSLNSSLIKFAEAPILPVTSPVSTSAYVIPATLGIKGPITLENSVSYNLSINLTNNFPNLIRYTSSLVNFTNKVDFYGYLRNITNLQNTTEELLFSFPYSYKDKADIINNNLIINCIVILGIAIIVVITYILSFFFPNKCFSILQINLLMLGVITCFYAASIAFIEGANYSQICSILKNVGYEADESTADNVLYWLGIYDTNDSSSEITKKCLFNYDYDQTPMKYYYLDTLNDIEYGLYRIEDYANRTYLSFEEIYYYEGGFIPDLLYSYGYQLSWAELRPLNESLPSSHDAMAYFNGLTNDLTPGCEIHDVWSYSAENCTSNYPYLYPFTNAFNSSYIGMNACLSLSSMNLTAFGYRYNSTFLKNCDQNGKIVAAYNTLFSYANSSKYAFHNISQIYNNMANIWKMSSRLASYIGDAALQMRFTSLRGIKSIQQLQTADYSCERIQDAAASVQRSVCRWGSAVSVLSFTLMMGGICGILYALFRASYVRYIKSKENIPANYIEMSPSSPLIDQRLPQQVPVYQPQNYVNPNYAPQVAIQPKVEFKPNFNAVPVKI